MSKVNLKNRKTKFVVWLYAHSDSRDDDWVIVWAHSIQEAHDNARFNKRRFSLGRVLTAKDFRDLLGFSAKNSTPHND